MANEITIYQGNDQTIEVTVTDSAGAAYDLSGAVLYFNVKRSSVDTVSLISKSSAIATEIKIIAPAANGVFEVYIVPDDTDDMSGDYFYDITLVIGGKTYTIVKAKFDISLPVK